MGDEIELAAKTSGEVVAALAEESGALAVPQEYASYIAARIHLRHYPALIERAMAVWSGTRLTASSDLSLDSELTARPLNSLSGDEEGGIAIKWFQHLVPQLCSPGCEPADLANRVGDFETIVDGDICQLAKIVGAREVDVCQNEGDLQCLLDCLLSVEAHDIIKHVAVRQEHPEGGKVAPGSF
jgi:hypothetical protein